MTRAQSLRVATTIHREMDRIESQNRRQMRAIVREMLVAMNQTYRRRGDVRIAIESKANELNAVVESMMVASHLMGIRRTAIAAQRRGVVQLSILGDAVEWLRKRINLTVTELNRLRDTYTKPAAEAVTNATQAIQRAAATATAEALREGLATDAGIAKVRKAMIQAGANPTQPHVYETVFRTQTAVAYSAGRVNSAKSPALADYIWGWEYVTAGDDRVRLSHEALDGVRLPKEDPRWDTIMPPNGYNCRCIVTEIFTDDPKEDQTPLEPPDVATIDGREVRPVPDAGWDFNPGQVYQDTVSVRGM